MEKRRNELRKSNFNNSRTEDDKNFLENWRRSNQKIPVKHSKKTQLKSKAKKKPIEGTPAVTCTQENISDQSNSPSNFPLPIASGTESPTIPPINNTTFSSKNLSTAAAIVNPSVSNSVALSTVVNPVLSSSSSNIHSAISVANRNFASVLPFATSSLAFVPQSLATTSNSNITSVIPLVTSSFNSTDTAQLSESSTSNSNLQPLTQLNLSVPSDNLTYSTFLSGLSPTSETSHTAVDVSSFSLQFTNSNTFSFSRRSFDSVGQTTGQTEFWVSSPLPLGFQTGFSEDVLPPSRSPSNINSLLPGHVNPGSPLPVEQINSKVDAISEKLDAVLENQRLIIDCLQNNGFIHNTSTSRTPTPTRHNIKELTTAELKALNITKKKGTTNGYFAVMLLKRYTTDEERINCTVHGGRKSKGLNKETLVKIKKATRLFIWMNHGVML